MNEANPKSRGLGRGLSALFEDDEEFEPIGHSGEESVTSENVSASGRIIIGVEYLTPSHAQPRTTFSEEALEQLAESIRTHGLLQPLLVRARANFPGQYEIIAGERRWRAAQKAQLHEVPALVLDISDQEAMEVALVENLQREDLSPVEEAKGYQRLMDEYGHSHEKLGQLLGKSRSHISNMTRLLALPPVVLKHLEEGDLSIGHARALLPATNPEKTAMEIIREGLNVRQTEKMVSQALGRPNKTKSSGPKAKSMMGKDADMLALENDLSSILGMKLSIAPTHNDSGIVKIEYKTLDQFDDICHRLTQFPRVGKVIKNPVLED